MDQLHASRGSLLWAARMRLSELIRSFVDGLGKPNCRMNSEF